MEIKDFEEQAKSLREISAIPQVDVPLVIVPDARAVLVRGIQWAVGEGKAAWLPEYEEVATWLACSGGKGLLLAGSCGRGKTLLATLVIPTILRYYAQKVIYCYAASAITPKELTECMTRKLVCIDDIGTEGVLNSYGNKIQVVPAIVDEAERTGKLLLLTTNMGGKDILAKYGMRTADRLRGLCRIVEFAGDSLRGRVNNG